MRDEKQVVLEYMQKHHLGVENAARKEDILRCLCMNERKFRQVFSELKHEGHVASTSQHGYWAIPLHTNSYNEIEAIKQSWLEMRSRAMSMLTDCDKALNELSKRVKQHDLFGSWCMECAS